MDKKTEKKYDFGQAEQEIQHYWQEEKVYSYQYKTDQQAILSNTYSIDTPPPTVSGSLHIGHIFSYTQTDIIARYKRMSGYNVFYPLGFDDNGLATERFVEKKLNIQAHDLTRSDFIRLCLEQTIITEKEFEKLWKRVGLSIDWSLNYSTIDFDSRKISQKSFVELYKNGYIYRKSEPAPYCTTCKTTVAQAELDDAEKPSAFNDIIFKVGQENLIVSTTRPELLPSVSALLYNPNDNRYKHLLGQKAIVPIYNYEIDILEDSDVSIEKGSGLVMVSTFGDKQDIIWAKKYNLPYIKSIDFDGRWTDVTGPLKGLKVHQARKKIIELLKENNLLVNQKNITHNVSVHERCKTEIEYLILTQWFLKILPFKSKFLELADKINWYPEFMKSRYINWVENINWDWCLSRQRFYGIPFPVWHCQDCQEVIIADEKDLPIDPQETNYQDKYHSNCPKCNSSSIVPDKDVMDTWNTSSLTPYIAKSLYAKNNPESQIEDYKEFDTNHFIPMSMRPQAHDIIRTWAFYTIVKSFMHSGTIPWKDIVISGHVLSPEKEKISKSQGNTPLTPETLLESHPADAIRYWTASGNLGYDVAFSQNQIAIGQRLIVKLLNAFKFLSTHLNNYNNQEKLEDFLNIGLVNEWIINNLNQSIINYKKHFENYEFKLALDNIDKFFWHDFCDNYLELIKDQLFNPQNYKEEQVKATLSTLYQVGLNILQLYAPFVPHITDNLYNLIYKKNINTKSIHQTTFNDHKIDLYFENSPQVMEHILSIIRQVRKLKSESNLSLKTEINKLTIYTNSNIKDILESEEKLIKAITRAQNIDYILSQESKLGITQEDNIINATVIEL
ncbi:valine--tRNA ligase [Candidatus Babela massiliensis]|uniref:Valine--tRNA ligase n=1 Tax=Candidatus Babela massiliensis TaxID=673862 RepID=V6DJX6_9BACT|nr:valine--tRNA ligase [Candidatus Babela massiliensis]CDK30816.1 valyl-tRNA synthetase [Candidatus Babela massiliensis]